MSTEKKTISYNGMDMECIDSGYWPDGVTLVCGAGYAINSVVCLQAGRVITKVGTTSQAGTWAILPPKPAPLRLTRREVYALWRKGWDYCSASGLICVPAYVNSQANEYVELNSKLRALNSDEWLEPTSDLLEVGE